MEPLAALDWMIRGGALALAVLTGVLVAWRGARPAIRIAAPLFLLSMAAYALNSAPAAREVLGPFKVMAGLGTHACVGCFWLLAMVLFEDRRLSPLLLAPPVGSFVIGAIGDLTPLGDGEALWTAFNAVCVALVIAVLAQVALSHGDDLIEPRRRLRLWFVAAFALLALLVLGAEFALPATPNPPPLSLLFAVGLLAVSGLGVAALVAIRPNPLLELDVRTTPPPLPAAQGDYALQRLEAVMGPGEAWRRERLTVKDLAREVSVSETALRRLISERLGFRNFPAFVNARRIEAAKAALADPARSRQTIAAIAFDFGFASLAPFNRAFREQTGVTPSEWRKQALGAT